MLGSNRKRIHILRVKKDHMARPAVGTCALAIVESIAESQGKGCGYKEGWRIGVPNAVRHEHLPPARRRGHRRSRAEQDLSLALGKLLRQRKSQVRPLQPE